MIENEQYFTDLLKKTGSFYNLENLIISTVKNKQVSDDYIQLAVSILLLRGIYCFSKTNEQDSKAESFEYNALNDTIKGPIYIGYNDSHFCPLLPLKANSITKKPLKKSCNLPG